MNLRAKLSELTDALHELKSNQNNDLQTFFAKENVHMKTFEQLASQVANVKSAIGTLADVVSEEIEHVKKVVIGGDIEQKLNYINSKVE